MYYICQPTYIKAGVPSYVDVSDPLPYLVGLRSRL